MQVCRRSVSAFLSVALATCVLHLGIASVRSDRLKSSADRVAPRSREAHARQSVASEASVALPSVEAADGVEGAPLGADSCLDAPTWVATLPEGASVAELGAFLKGMRAVASLVESVSKLSNFVLNLALNELQAMRGSLMVLDPEGRFLRIRAARGLSRDVKRQTRLPLGHGVAGVVADLALPLLVNTDDAAVALPLKPHRYRSSSFVSVPLSSGGRVVGVLNVTERVGAEDFSQQDLDTLVELASHVGPALGCSLHYQAARQLALRDALTGLYNRRYLWTFLDQLLRRARRQNFPVTLVLFDLDHFKQFNDQFGHPAGDEALKRFAEIMRRTFRLRDVCCRVGGEEFAVVLSGAPNRRAQKRRGRSRASDGQAPSGYVFAERLRRATSRYAFSHSGPGVGLTLSGGLASFPEDAQDRSELFEKADQALYRAKCQGRNRICLPGSGD